MRRVVFFWRKKTSCYQRAESILQLFGAIKTTRFVFEIKSRLLILKFLSYFILNLRQPTHLTYSLTHSILGWWKTSCNVMYSAINKDQILILKSTMIQARTYKKNRRFRCFWLVLLLSYNDSLGSYLSTRSNFMT